MTLGFCKNLPLDENLEFETKLKNELMNINKLCLVKNRDKNDDE